MNFKNVAEAKFFIETANADIRVYESEIAEFVTAIDTVKAEIKQAEAYIKENTITEDDIFNGAVFDSKYMTVILVETGFETGAFYLSGRNSDNKFGAIKNSYSDFKDVLGITKAKMVAWLTERDYKKSTKKLALV